MTDLSFYIYMATLAISNGVWIGLWLRQAESTDKARHEVKQLAEAGEYAAIRIDHLTAERDRLAGYGEEVTQENAELLARNADLEKTNATLRSLNSHPALRAIK